MCAAEMPTLLKAGPAPAMCTTQGGPSTCLSTPLTTPASVGPSAAAYVLLDTCLAGWRLSQESKDTWPHPDPDRERPSASLVYEERDPGVRELRMLERVGMHLLCPSASGNQCDKRHKK